MDYAHLLYVIEVRKLALGLARGEAPKDGSDAERQIHIRDNFRKCIATAVDEIEFAAQIIDEIKAKDTK